MSQLVKPYVGGNRPKTAGLNKKLQIKAASGAFYGLLVYSQTAQYIQLHEGLAAPVNGDIPLITMEIGAAETKSLVFPMKFTGGLWACNSTTDATLTAGADDCLMVGREE